MPFKSLSQMRLCFSQQSKGKAKGWDCKKWAKETKSIKSLPKKVSSRKNKKP